MNQRTRLLIAIIVAIVVAVTILAVALVQCGARPAPVAETPGATAATTTLAATNVLTDAATDVAGEPIITTGPTPTFTKEDELVATSQHDSSQSVSSPEECAKLVFRTFPIE